MNEDFAVLADLEHSLRGPIAMAYRRARDVMAGHLSAQEMSDQIRAIMGLCGRARQILRNIDLLVKLHRNQPIDLNVVRLSPADIVERLTTAAEEAKILAGRGRNEIICINPADYDPLDRLSVLADLDLMEQAFRAIIDNATKYSFPRTPIRISGGVGAGGEFTISFVSEGLEISPEDLQHVGERGWRGRQAMLTTGTGSGIGLWLVDNILRAHRGKLMVAATNSRDETIVTLSLPTI